MFQFGFSSSEVKCDIGSGDNTDKTIDWRDCEEVTIEESVDDLVDYSIFSVGNLEVRCISTANALRNAVTDSLDCIIAAESNHSDLIPGKYEGGLKTWECTRDLADWLTALDLKWEGLRVLDLGCGTGVLGLIALIAGSNVTFQDYNKEVLELITRRNVLLNVPKVTAKQVQFYGGDWSSFRQFYTRHHPDEKFDLIVSSETVYNASNYGKLHDAVHGLLAPAGTCYLAGKSVYFGVGGSMRAFRDFAVNRGCLKVEPCWAQSQGEAR